MGVTSKCYWRLVVRRAYDGLKLFVFNNWIAALVVTVLIAGAGQVTGLAPYPNLGGYIVLVISAFLVLALAAFLFRCVVVVPYELYKEKCNEVEDLRAQIPSGEGGAPEWAEVLVPAIAALNVASELFQRLSAHARSGWDGEAKDYKAQVDAARAAAQKLPPKERLFAIDELDRMQRLFNDHLTAVHAARQRNTVLPAGAGSVATDLLKWCVDDMSDRRDGIPGSFPYDDVDWRRCEWERTAGNGLDNHPTMRRYKQNGYTISTAVEENLRAKLEKGARVAVFRDPNRLFTAGTGTDADKTYFIRSKPSEG